MKTTDARQLVTLGLLSMVAVSLALNTAACEGGAPPEAHETSPSTPSDAEHSDAGSAGTGSELASSDDDSTEQHPTWCDDGAAVLTSFQTRTSGKTVSVCDEGDSLTYMFGHLGDEPELVYSGPLLGSASGTAVLWGEGVSSLADLAADLNSPDSVWNADPVVSELAEASDTKGFFSIQGFTGLLDQSVYVFRRMGWEYAIVSEWGRGMNLPEMEGHESYSISVRSPSGKTYYPD